MGRTSNQSAGDIQDIESKKGKKIYEKMGQLVKNWGQEYLGESGYSNLGAVVGATYPQELNQLRSLMPGVFFLIPGYGAQGGGAKDVAVGFDKDGLGAVVNSARGIIFSYRKNDRYNEKEFAIAAKDAAKIMKKSVNRAIEKFHS